MVLFEKNLNMTTRNSLGGKNKGGRTTCARSSRASSTIFKKLRKFDREIAAIDRRLIYAYNDRGKLLAKRAVLDVRRKLIRNARKATGFSGAVI